MVVSASKRLQNGFEPGLLAFGEDVRVIVHVPFGRWNRQGQDRPGKAEQQRDEKEPTRIAGKTRLGHYLRAFHKDIHVSCVDVGQSGYWGVEAGTDPRPPSPDPLQRKLPQKLTSGGFSIGCPSGSKVSRVSKWRMYLAVRLVGK